MDISNSDYDLDVTALPLPWDAGAFEAIVSQHLIEHLHLEEELLPLLRELRRVSREGAEIWLSCPDIEKVCQSYIQHRMRDLIDDRRQRIPTFDLGDVPTSHFINHLFHQSGEHRNLFDFDLLKWCLERSGFGEVEKVSERDLLDRFEGFPARNDDRQSLYVKAVANN